MRRRAVEVSPRAVAEIEEVQSWWLLNRSKAPWAFVEALEDAFTRLEEDAGSRPVVGPRGLRRIFLARVRYHLYYRIRDDDTVDVLALWQSNRRPLAL